MKQLRWVLVGMGLALVVLGGGALVTVTGRGIGARGEPSRLEAWVARGLRHLAIPAAARRTVNPVSPTESVLAMGRAHWADHCAICHGNDGRGDTAIGRGLYPRAPDMRLPATQTLSDGELFYIIENGVRFTGMPGWGGDGPERDTETWHLVQFVRHVPDLTRDELLKMEQLNPKTPAELADQEETRAFLDGAPEPAQGGEGPEAPGGPDPD